MKTYLIALLSAILLSACSHAPGKYEEVGQKYHQITGIKSLRITVRAIQPKYKEWEGRLADQIVENLKNEKIFKVVTLLSTDPKRKTASVGDLGASLDAVVWLEDVLTRTTNGTSEVVAKATVSVKRSENGQEFSRFKVAGNSAQPAKTILSLAEHFTEYFSDKISR